MVKKYIVRLSDQERQHLEEIVKRLTRISHHCFLRRDFRENHAYCSVQ